MFFSPFELIEVTQTFQKPSILLPHFFWRGLILTFLPYVMDVFSRLPFLPFLTTLDGSDAFWSSRSDSEAILGLLWFRVARATAESWLWRETLKTTTL